MSGSSVFRLVRLGAVFVALAASAAVFAAAAAGAGYVALGDSYSSGVGTNSYTLASGCKRSVYAYPYLYTQQHPGTSLSFVACSGAKTSDVLTTQMTAVTTATTLVTMTVGGNDIGFANLIYQCTLWDCSAALDRTRANLETTLGAPLDNVFTTVKARAAFGAAIIVLGYPRVFSTTSCFGTLGISSTERTKANALADALNQVIATHAAADGVTYRSAIGPFTGHAVCSSSPWLNGLNLLNTGESYHPNRSGHSAGYLPLVTAVTG
ncbi:MAG TPA: SGNH/GDSL hydrolase family protein [Gaiellaceae bacterium]|nr:SGNH/GDSL hydrolase family protein [Gaiellaceae bacterium]